MEQPQGISERARENTQEESSLLYNLGTKLMSVFDRSGTEESKDSPSKDDQTILADLSQDENLNIQEEEKPLRDSATDDWEVLNDSEAPI